MKRPTRVNWWHCVLVAIGLAVGIGVIAIWAIHAESERSMDDARRQSQIDAMGFAQAAEAWTSEQAAEGWISLEARQSFQRVVDLMLLGEAAYIQVVLGNAVIVNSADEDWSSSVPFHVSSTLEALSTPAIQSTRGRLLADTVVPMGPWKPDDPDGPTSYVRVGYELKALASHLRTIRLAGAGIALAAFLVACVSLMLILAWLDHRDVLWSPLNGIVHSLSVAAMRPKRSLVLDEPAKRVVLHGKPMFLPPKPFHMLSLLVREEGRVLQEDEIVGTLWPEANLADSRDVRQCVYLLRKHLEATVAGAGACVANVRGFGYRYDAASLDSMVSKHEPELLANLRGGISGSL